MQNVSQLNQETKELIQKLKSRPRALKDKLKFVNCITEYVQSNKYDADFISRAISQLARYAPIIGNEWAKEELMDNVDQLTKACTNFFEQDKIAEFRKIALELQKWFTSNEFLNEDFIRIIKGKTHRDKQDGLTNIRRFLTYLIRKATIENLEWLNSLSTNWISPFDLVVFTYKDQHHNTREPLAATFLKCIARLQNAHYLGDETTKQYLNALKKYESKLGNHTKIAFYRLLSNYLDNTTSVIKKTEIQRYDQWLIQYIMSQYNDEKGKFYTEFDRIFKRENDELTRLALRYMYQLKVSEGIKIPSAPSFFLIYDLETTIDLLIKQGLTNNAKFELDNFFNNFKLKADVKENVANKYQRLLNLKQKTWYQNANAIAPDVAQLAQPAIQYFNNLTH